MKTASLGRRFGECLGTFPTTTFRHRHRPELRSARPNFAIRDPRHNDARSRSLGGKSCRDHYVHARNGWGSWRPDVSISAEVIAWRQTVRELRAGLDTEDLDERRAFGAVALGYSGLASRPSAPSSRRRASAFVNRWTRIPISRAVWTCIGLSSMKSVVAASR